MITFLAKSTIKAYQIFLSPFLTVIFGRACRHSPTCSEYTYKAIEKHGVVKGLFMGVKRTLSCNSFGSFVFDKP